MKLIALVALILQHFKQRIQYFLRHFPTSKPWKLYKNQAIRTVYFNVQVRKLLPDPYAYKPNIVTLRLKYICFPAIQLWANQVCGFFTDISPQRILLSSQPEKSISIMVMAHLPSESFS